MAVWIDTVIRVRWLSLIWIRAIEPLLRFWPTYPPDWELRRMLVFERAHGQCEFCRCSIGSIVPGGEGWRVVGAHVHHAKPISRGGRHGLENLRLICARCHCAQHPENTRLREILTRAAPRPVPPAAARPR
jgi:5-methylcytosine-specific restriction endonuclease McrA